MPPSSPEAPSASAGWREGDPVGARRFARLGALSLESGVELPAVRVAYETAGLPRRDERGAITNAVLVLHALTGDAHVAGPAGPGQPTAGWWDPLIGDARPVDTGRWFVVSANVLGGCQGTTGPSSTAPDGLPWGSRFPALTIRDQVRAEAALADELGIDRFALVVGGSMGGMRALEWAAMYPDRVGVAVVLASCAAATADQIGTQSIQVAAIRSDPGWQGGDYYGTGAAPSDGLGLARRIAHLTYRSADELEQRFGRRPQPETGGFAVQSYLDHHAAKLNARFDAGSYVTLTEAMNTHDLGRGRGGVAAALAALTTPVLVAGIDSDRLYPLQLQRQLADLIPTAEPLRVITSAHGHDGFLLETEQVAEVIAQATAAIVQLSPR
ncbi:homoserine O-acetyltransferase [Jatrophihabitans sp.]|uniref:homoserine O-acetyltransferase MetX n=1 Tax=Jatrophihabitans sp. TaxID=1932789 RepID=UPI0030C7472F|nr:homoserine O-acetyltransferase [Jatrophihabitans sp.]